MKHRSSSRPSSSHGFSSILRATGLMGAVQVFSILTSILRNKCTALLIGAAGIGLIDLFNQGIALLGNATNFGLSFTAVQRLSVLTERGDRAGQRRYVAHIRTWGVITAVFGALVCFVLSPALSYFTVGHVHGWGLWALLSPAIAFSTLVGCEGAILKGTHQLRRLALLSGATALVTLCVSVVTYWLFSVDGVIPVLVLCLAAQWALFVFGTRRTFPYRINWHTRGFRRHGMYLLGIGAGYIVAGIVGSGAELAVRSFFVSSSIEMAGLYAVGFALTVTYTRLVFVAIDADYFPRLSAVAHDARAASAIANRQIDTLVMLMAPLLILFGILLPIIIPLLYSNDFLAVRLMVIAALPGMLFKAVYTPIAYLSLARAESKMYLLMESLYYLVFCLLIPSFYELFKWLAPHILPLPAEVIGLFGVGFALTLTHIFDTCTFSWYYRRRYGFTYERPVLRRAATQAFFVILGLLASLPGGWGWHTVAGGACFLLSALLSWRLLTRETNLLRRWTRH